LSASAGTWIRRKLLRADEAALRALGLSRQKISYVRDLSRKALDGHPLETLSRRSDEGVIETLTTIRGVGRWTAEMLLMFRLGRLDVLPVDDYGIRKASRRRTACAPSQARPHAADRGGLRPYRTVACWYLWRSLDAK